MDHNSFLCRFTKNIFNIFFFDIIIYIEREKEREREREGERKRDRETERERDGQIDDR